jgi:hypothetical protein
MEMIKAKIEKAITDCNGCRYCKRFITETDNCTTLFICNYKNEVLGFLNSRREAFHREIPGFCPLTDITISDHNPACLED